MGLSYFVLDVFTEAAFGGNPLAVVLDADRLTDAQMQKIAREFSLSETVFVLKAESPGHTARVRIFTPVKEIPFAGHPTLGTAILLAEQRMPVVNGERDAIIALEEQIGSVRIGVRLREGGAHYGEFDAPKGSGELAPLNDPDGLSAALGLIPSEIGFENHKPMILQNTTTFAYVPVTNLEAIAKARIVAPHWGRVFSERNCAGVYLYTRQCVRASAAFHARMFAPDLGVPEDPATGSAAIGFARVIHAFDGLTDGQHKRSVEQGLEIDRPSSIGLVISVHGGALTGVRIGGHAVRVAEGTLHL